MRRSLDPYLVIARPLLGRRVAGHCQALAGRRLAAGVGLAVANRRLPLQLKKKPKIMQQHLDYCFPGLWLSKITPRSYKANE
ncbi:hypothetical protein ZIOFF_003279 [Zingiber officinale]|uniref:Uncharacterized protein n=1 Tax=Zingiber officinale TaxID=94328 RepID=A0A8J5I954_ZINOF|nr:hypothetical protein ZIOFF_003279 [Zingiber officinale]